MDKVIITLITDKKLYEYTQALRSLIKMLVVLQEQRTKPHKKSIWQTIRIISSVFDLYMLKRDSTQKKRDSVPKSRVSGIDRWWKETSHRSISCYRNLLCKV